MAWQSWEKVEQRVAELVEKVRRKTGAISDLCTPFFANMTNSLLLEAQYAMRDEIVQTLYDKGVYEVPNLSKAINGVRVALTTESLREQVAK